MDEEHEYDIDNLGLLTQYIGPRPSHQKTSTTNTEDQPTELIEREMKAFKEKYAQETHSLDRACNHWEALKAAQAKNKIPAKLQITVKPQVINKEQPEFSNKWNSIVKTAEKDMMQCIIQHLESTQSDTRDSIRAISNETLNNLRQIDPTGAIKTLNWPRRSRTNKKT